MDPRQELAFTADAGAVVAVIGRGLDFLLVDLCAPLPQDILRDALGRGLQFAGVLALVNGEPQARCERMTPDVVLTMMLAGVAFGERMAEKLRSQALGDSEAWLCRLYELRDTRGEDS
jgi:hypothetical protein